MEVKRRYFDNAATSYPKPERVYEAMDHYNRQIGASAGRGIYREAIASGELIEGTRKRIATLLKASSPDNIIMTFNCSDGLNMAIKGVLTEPGCHVVTTRMEHNSVLRPLGWLEKEMGLEITWIEADEQGLCDPEAFGKAIRPNTRLIACVHGSNVCGSVQDIARVGAIAREAAVPFLVDAAQTAGHLPIDVEALGVDLLAFPGHKALLGPLGTGVLYIRPGFEQRLRTLKEGGTGSRSEVAYQPELLPDRFEPGSHNAVGIAGLYEGVGWLLEQGLTSIREHERRLCELFLQRTADIEGLTVYGPKEIDQRVGVFSVAIAGYSPAELSTVLEQHYGLLTRPGLHCAPYAHQAIGSFKAGGTARFSFGPFLTEQDVIVAAEGVCELAGSTNSVV